jgi:hypothetical protein
VSGYVRIHRPLFEEHPAFRNDAEAMAFAWMIVKAQWRPKAVRYKGHKIELQRGQLAVSQRDMARALDRDKAWVERLWKRLRAEAMIETACEAGVAVITICKYSEYQADAVPCEAADEAPEKADARQTRGTEQEREEREEGNKSSNDDSSSDDEPALAVTEVFQGYQTLAKSLGLPVPRDLTPERRQLIRFRIGQYPIEDFQTVFAKCRDSPFLRGDKGRTPLTIDWLMQKKNFQKVLEGNYD